MSIYYVIRRHDPDTGDVQTFCRDHHPNPKWVTGKVTRKNGATDFGPDEERASQDLDEGEWLVAINVRVKERPWVPKAGEAVEYAVGSGNGWYLGTVAKDAVAIQTVSDCRVFHKGEYRRPQ